MTLPPLPELTQSPVEQDHPATPRSGSLVPVAVRRELDVTTASRGVAAHVGHLAALWVLLERYAGGEELPPIGVVSPDRGPCLLSLRSSASDTFGEIVDRVDVALADAADVDVTAGDAADGHVGGRVVFAWQSGDDAARLAGDQGIVVRVSGHGTHDVRIHVEDSGRVTPRAAAVEADLLAITAALVGSDGPAAEVDAFSPREGTDAAAPQVAGPHRLVDLVARHASQAPDAVAVRGVRALTYSQLDEDARRVGLALQSIGVKSEDRVAVLLERDEHLAVGLLGVQVSGAAFVPISTEDPTRRQREILADAGARVVVSTGRTADHLAGDLHVVRIEECRDLEVSGPLPVAAPEHAAYVLYTSGSSGKPKGVVVEHRHLSAYVEGFLERVGGGERPLSCALVQPLTVDSSLTCVAAAWATGGELHVIDRATALDLDRLDERLRSHAVDVLKIAPSHLRALQAAGDVTCIMPRTALVVGGEASDWRWLQELDESHACAVYNHYGPTETTVGVLMLSVREHRGRSWTTAALGRPLPGCEIGVVDRHGNEVPAGIRGEIVVRGSLVARGYQAEPADSGFRPWRGAHAYWTGDRGIRERDGVICFAGRADDQVKVRGYRVELGEIERSVCAHPDVTQAVALVDDTRDGAAVLRCAVRASGGQQLDPADLSAHCRALLPLHMVPTSWVQLEEIPRSAHGKIDRRELREHMAAAHRRTADAPHGTSDAVGDPVAPSALQKTALREQVARAWDAVLDTPAAGHDVNFFDAGGHSLLLLDLQRELVRRTGRDVDLLDLFQHPTILGQAELLRASATTATVARTSNGRERREAVLRRRRLRQAERSDG